MASLDNDSVVYVERDMGNGLKAIMSPIIFGEACVELRVTEAADQLYLSCALYFCKCAHHSIDVHEKQVTLEEETDINASLRTVLESCMAFYGVDDMNRLANFFGRCRLYAFNHSLHWNPKFQAWIDSAGRAYDEITREEKAWNKEN